jgi:cytochrome c oxidase subunit 4
MASTTADAHVDHAHPTQELYVRIAIMLAIITGIEVAIYYIPALEGVLVPALVALSAIKFAVVVGYFMHLKFDDSFLTFVFASALILSIVAFIALWIMMYYDAASIFHPNMSLSPEKPERP